MPKSITIAALSALLAGAFFSAWQGAHWAATVGAAIAAGAPLVFLLFLRGGPLRLDGHPLAVSIISGFGCVLVMTAETRFGPTGGKPLLVSLLALAVWMLWQRGHRKRPGRRRG